MEITIGLRFNKPLNKGKFIECEVVDIVHRISTVTGKIIDIEYYAKSVNGDYFQGKSFEVSKTTIIRYLIQK